MIQFETVKYGILKPKDNQRNIKGEQIFTRHKILFSVCGCGHCCFKAWF